MNDLAALYTGHLETLRERTDTALAACGFDALAVHAGRPHVQFLDDAPYPFKVNPHFKSWIPLLDAPDSWLVYRPGERLKLIFLQPLDYWHAAPATPQDYWVEHVDLTIIREPAAARSAMPKGRWACLSESDIDFREWGAAATNPAALLDALHFPRARKTAYELECLRRATARGVLGHLAAERAFREGGSEFEIHLAYLAACGQQEEELPYASIIALNEHAAVLHYTRLARRAPTEAERHSFLIDAGAQFGGYACDITRTYAFRRGEFAELIDGMDQAQRALCAEVKAGIDYAAIHLSAHRRIAAVLREADLINVDADRAVESGLSSVFFPHGIGHLLGLQVHDVAGLMIAADGREKPRPPGHPYLRLTRQLEPGFVVTIEPGLYFIDLLLDEARKGPHARDIRWDRVETLRRFGGIRIEDDVVCTAGEPENLTRAAFAAAA